MQIEQIKTSDASAIWGVTRSPNSHRPRIAPVKIIDPNVIGTVKAIPMIPSDH